MRFVGNMLFKGLATVLPVGLTIYLVYWLGVTVEGIFRTLITNALPDQYYYPGMGLLAGFILLFFIGLAINAWVFRRLIGLGENLLERIPLVKSVYSTLRDFMDYFYAAQQREEMGNVVMVSFGDARLIGFLTRERPSEMTGLSMMEDMVAVYLPMSYQIGGYTAYLPKSRVEKIDLSVEDAMRMVLTAGLSASESEGKRQLD